MFESLRGLRVALGIAVLASAAFAQRDLATLAAPSPILRAASWSTRR